MLKRISMDITQGSNLRNSTNNGAHRSSLHFLDFDAFRSSTSEWRMPDLEVVQVGYASDPLAHPHFSRFIAYIRSRTDAQIDVHTDGILLSEHFNSIIANGCSVTVSLESLDDRLYSRMRGPGRLDKVLNVLRKAGASKFPLTIHTTWMNSNIEEFDKMVEFCKSNGFNLEGAPLVIREHQGTISLQDIDESLWFDQQALQNLKDKYQSCMQGPGSGVLRERRFLTGGNGRIECHGHEHLIILPDGSCLICGNQTIGNLFHDGLSAILNGGAFGQSPDKQRGGCGECDYPVDYHAPSPDDLKTYVSRAVYLSLSNDSLGKLTLESKLPDEVRKTVFMLAATRSFRLELAEPRDAPPIKISSEKGAPAHTDSVPTLPSAPGKKLTEPRAIDQYNGFTIFLLESMYFAVPEGSPVVDVESLTKHARCSGLIIDELKDEIRLADSNGKAGRQKALFVCNVAPDYFAGCLNKLRDYDITLLCLPEHWVPPTPLPVVFFPEEAREQEKAIQELRERDFDVAIIPYNEGYLESTRLERLVSSFSKRLITLFPDGRTRLYKAADIHRIIYNKDYVASMLGFVPELRGKKILEVGCGDGLACDLLLSENPDHVTGVDILPFTGCNYSDSRISYARMDASKLDFDNESFDVCYSIATFEHCKNPAAALQEIKRVLRPGGYAYVQVGPLYHSPFGHHMFGYFDDYPWIHLRLSREEIIRYSKETGVDKKIKANLGRSIEEYIDLALGVDHVNGKRISEYGLESFMQSPDIEVLSFTKTKEGEDLLTDSILKDIEHIGREDLTLHGFELVFRLREGKPNLLQPAPAHDASRYSLPTPKPAPDSYPVKFSFLLPTRGRPDLVNRLFQSIVETTSSLKDIEIIMAIDDDDLPTQKVSHDKLTIKKVIIPKGLTMGAMNNACFEASSGQFVMLINDDIILRTKGWDEVVSACFGRFQDDVGLIHVNDLLFRDVLCTFPFISRRACMEIGLCPSEYKRYKIDDHIYDVYNLLACMGHRRITYLPDVIFEHENHEQLKDPQKTRNYFKSADNKFYVPDQDIAKRDDAIFRDRFQERKEAALRLAAIIEGDKHRRVMEARRKSQANIVGGITELYSYRNKDFVSSYSQLDARSNALPRATVAVVTADIRGDYASRCVSLVKQHTSNFDLIVLDNSRDKGFNHPREMNKVMRTIDTDLLVLLDDDIYVEPGWLVGLIRSMDERTGVVAPLHKDGAGKISFTGCYLAGDGQGNHEHTLDVPSSVRSTQTCCSAAILIDMRKCGHILMQEVYKKYFFDLVHSLEIWEAGYKVVVTPEVVVTHLGGATSVRGTASSNQLFDIDRRMFVNQWVKTGRLAKLEQKVWNKDPYIRTLVEAPRRISGLEAQVLNLKLNDFIHLAAEALSASVKIIHHDNNFLVQRIKNILNYYISVASSRGEYDSAKSCLPLLVRQLRNSPEASGTVHRIIRDLEMMGANIALSVDRYAAAQELKHRALSRYKAGDKPGAEQSFLQALEKAPRDSDILVSLGRICYELQRYKEAMKYNEAALSINSRDTEAWVGLALIARDLKSPDAMRAACEQVRNLNPEHPKYRELTLELR